MRKPIAILLALLISIPTCAVSAPVNAAEAGELRVGLESKFSRKSSIAVNNTEITLGYEQNGQFAPSAALTSKAGFTVTRLTGYYVTLTEHMYPDYQTALAWSSALAFPSVPHMMPSGMYHICVGPFAGEGAAKDYALGIGGVLHPLNSHELLLSEAGGAALVMFEGGGQAADPQTGIVSLDNTRYRGRVEFFAAGDGVSAVNALPMEAYLYGVVPVESPSSFHAEALKAQAVAARTYALSSAKAHGGGSYLICDTTHCQAYGGADKESGAATAAVDATRGQILAYNGAPIEAMFFASSGGFTENSQNVWSASLPYLVSVAELNEPPSTWTRTYPFDQLDAIADIGQVQSVSVATDPASGRAQELTLVGSSGERSVKKEEIRSFFAKAEAGALPSRLFSLLNGAAAPSQNLSPYAVSSEGRPVAISFDHSFATNGGRLQPAAYAIVLGASGATSGYARPTAAVSTVTRSAGSVTFSGAGSGHGVGMSQQGANGMAQLGYAYEEILKHYYTGVTLTQK